MGLLDWTGPTNSQLWIPEWPTGPANSWIVIASGGRAVTTF